MADVYVFLADGFEEVEGLTVVDLLRRADIDVAMVSITDTMEILGAHGIVITADKVFDEVNIDEADMLVLPGGMPGTKNLAKHDHMIQKLVEFHEQEKWIAAICAAPSILGMNDLLKGKEATCYPGYEDQLVGAECSLDKVVVDENIITSRGVGTAIDFALTLIEKLKDQETANRIQESIIYE